MITRRFCQLLPLSALLDRPLIVLPSCFCSTSSHPFSQPPRTIQQRSASGSASSTRWLNRQGKDTFAKQAKVAGLKSRAAYKLLQINEKFRIFRKGDTVVDLGYAPGSWSQVAINRTAPGGRVVGVDMLPAQPPRGVSTIQGNFLSPEIQAEVRAYLLDPDRGRQKSSFAIPTDQDGDKDATEVEVRDEQGYIERSAESDLDASDSESPQSSSSLEASENDTRTLKSRRARDEAAGRVADVVLSDMSEPWDQTNGLWINSVSNPYRRLMNTSGIPYKDHTGSMDLCYAALSFCFDTLRSGGHFVCKFYQGNEDKYLETRLKRLFTKVHRAKPAASRSESREGYFVALKRKEGPARYQVFAE